MEIQLVEKILGRKQHAGLINCTSDKRVLVTGGGGSIGQHLAERLPNATITDKYNLDVTSRLDWNRLPEFDYVIHLAGAKHAPEGEDSCIETLEINTLGVTNGLSRFPDAHHVLASTCKACNPETVYGATKLIAERLVMNKGGSVARFYNVVQTSGNVFEIWQNGGNQVADCLRYFISVDEAVGLLIHALENKGRFSVNPLFIRSMLTISTFFGEMTEVPRRRGDRRIELIKSTSETVTDLGEVLQIKSWNDI